MFLNPLPQALSDRAAGVDESRADIPTSFAIGHQRERWLAGLTLYAEQIIFVHRIAFRLQPVGRWAAAVLAAAYF